MIAGMKSIIISVLFVATGMQAYAQESEGTTERTTVYEKYQRADVILTSGDTLKLRAANVFLKNGRLIYKRGMTNMEADMDNIVSVDFPDRTYLKIDTALAYVVDTVGEKQLLCTALIDIDAYKTILENSREITNLELSQYVNVTSNEISDDVPYPVIHVYYYMIDGEIIKVHERNIFNRVSKDKRRAIKTIIQSPDFSWKNEAKLMEILKLM